ncbi:MAG: GNAT family N-acetyltransferase [Cytophagales bacterium CG18_big_fil_WC_8_21_14_2_50_42_9]|nr:MAG: GNAT family N-acetyltransferase [Cytophagales bacterium CG18_big_fil_WC_8_21_14_2_50_42_9]
MFLKTNTLYLRALESSDLEFLYALENSVSVWRVSNTVVPFSREVIAQYLEQAALDIYTTKQLRLVICTPDHTAIGAIDLFDFEPLHHRAGVGIIILPPYQRQNFASQALALLLNYCLEHLLLHQVYCSVAADNAASLRLFQKHAFRVVGKREQWLKTSTGWLDVWEFQKIFINPD